MRTLILKVSGWKWMEKFVRRSFLFRPVVRRFIGGDTFEDGLKNSEPLLDRGFLISLDLLGESVSSAAEAEASKDEYIRMIEAISRHPKYVAAILSQENKSEFERIESINISIKLTQCGLDLSEEIAEAHYRETLRAATSVGSFVRIDMESTDYTDRTIEIVEKVHRDFLLSGTVLQSYLMRTPDDLARLNRNRIRLRLVKGAYLESPQHAFQDKAKVDLAYVDLARTMLAETNYPAFATHDSRLVDEIISMAEEMSVPKSSFEFQMLFGISRDLQDRLLAEGFRVRVYVPFGDSWYPYFSRRLAERPANLWFIAKALFKR